MGRYVIRRVLQFIPVVLGTMFLIHYATTLGIQFNGDPVRALFGQRQVSPSTLEAMRERFNLDSPCLRQIGNPCLGLFAERFGSYLQGDLGVNFRLEPVTNVLARAWPITLRLTILAVAIEAILGIFAGVLAGLRKDGVVDNVTRATTTFLVAVPVFVFGVLVQIGTGVYLGVWLEGQSWAPDWLTAIFTVTYSGDDPWLSLIIPAVVLASFSLASISRLTRTSVIENLTSDYVRAARAKGLKESRVVGVHTLRNSLIAVVTYLGADFGFLINGAIVTEGVFNIPGIGGLTFLAAQEREVPVVIAIVTILTLIFLVANLLVDISYAVLDPRVRYD